MSCDTVAMLVVTELQSSDRLARRRKVTDRLADRGVRLKNTRSRFGQTPFKQRLEISGRREEDDATHLLRRLQPFRIRSEDQVANVGIETAPPVREISGNHDDIARTDMTAHAALDSAALEIRPLRIRTGAR